MRDMLLPVFTGMIEKIKPGLPNHTVLDEFISLKNLYLEHHRHYHNWHHISKIWGEFDNARHLFHDSLAAEFALFYHDCIYTPTINQPCNEIASYQRAEFVLRKLGMIDIHFLIRVEFNILYAVNDQYEGHDSILFKDMDYTILGKPHKEYEEYRKNISKEYIFAPMEERVTFLQSLLTRKKIFRSEYFHNLYEEHARKNIKHELESIV
jgi:predicted metal-dependent HD superfamily phosphohydrolase